MRGEDTQEKRRRAGGLPLGVPAGGATAGARELARLLACLGVGARRVHPCPGLASQPLSSLPTS